MAAPSSKCTGVCKEPTFLLDELEQRTVYRDRPVVSKGNDKHFLGVMRARKVIFFEGEFYSYEPNEDKPGKALKVIDKCYWDSSWKALRKNDKVGRIFEYEPSIMGELPCTCEQMLVTLDKVVGHWAYRDRPKVVYSKSGKLIIPNFDYEFCGVRNRITVEKVGAKYFGTNVRKERLEIDPSLHDYHWKVYVPTGQEVEEPDEEIILESKEPSSEPTDSKEKEQVIASVSPDPVSQTAGAAHAAPSKIHVESPLRKSRKIPENLASVRVESMKQDPEVAPPESDDEPLQLPPPPLPPTDALSSVRVDALEIASNPETPANSENAKREKRQKANLCARICCCFKSCCPSLF